MFFNASAYNNVIKDSSYGGWDKRLSKNFDA